MPNGCFCSFKKVSQTVQATLSKVTALASGLLKEILT